MNETLVEETTEAALAAVTAAGGDVHGAHMVLEGCALSKVYTHGPKEVRAIDGVSLALSRGEFLVVVGPSGAGKSTLLHLLGGLDSPTGGRVLLDGLDLYALSEAKLSAVRNERIGLVFQFYHLLPEFTAFENVVLPALMRSKRTRAAKRAIEDRARGLLETFGLGGRVDHKPQELSGGESQRVAIARALINGPDILLCDEPTGNLDSSTGKDVMELLTRVNKKEKVSLVMATHDESVKERADSIVYLKDGKIVGQGKSAA